jgi:hypothetical protein
MTTHQDNLHRTVIVFEQVTGRTYASSTAEERAQMTADSSAKHSPRCNAFASAIENLTDALADTAHGADLIVLAAVQAVAAGYVRDGLSECTCVKRPASLIHPADLADELKHGA